MSQAKLFGDGGVYGGEQNRPLADSLRPATWDEYEGSDRIDPALLQVLKRGTGVPPSLILWGPPGCGKTTVARLIGATFDCNFVEFSAVLSGVKEVREIVGQARNAHKPTVLFVDEIHRFNKSQQDAFLPHVERGTIVLIGATTENPSFSLNAALLSRCTVAPLSALSDEAIAEVLKRAADKKNIDCANGATALLSQFSGGDARKLINAFEGIVQSENILAGSTLSSEQVKSYLGAHRSLFYDRSGEEHYNMVSAFIKSMRGSSPDAALYWGLRMIESGEDPNFILRRMIIFASEDIGNADPRALQIATSAATAFDRIGMPEGRIIVAQAITYLATAPKSNRSYAAMNMIVEKIREKPKVEVPMHLRNAPTSLMKEVGYGKEYEYPHDTPEGYSPGIDYLPANLVGEEFYRPTKRGYEIRIGERMAFHKGLDQGKQ